MTVARIYRMVAADGEEVALKGILVELAPVVSALPGCTGAEVMQDIADPSRFLFIERWDSIAAHKDSESRLPKTWFTRMKPLIALPPESSYMELLCVGS